MNDWTNIIGSVWISPPEMLNQHSGDRYVRICIKTDDDQMVSVDRLRVDPEGAYFSKSKPLGTIEDEKFQEYIFKLTGIKKRQFVASDVTALTKDKELHDKVCESFKYYGNIGKVVKEHNIPKERVRRILITYGLYTNEKVEKIRELAEQGHSNKKIAEVMGMSESSVRAHMPY